MSEIDKDYIRSENKFFLKIKKRITVLKDTFKNELN